MKFILFKNNGVDSSVISTSVRGEISSNLQISHPKNIGFEMTKKMEATISKGKENRYFNLQNIGLFIVTFLLFATIQFSAVAQPVKRIVSLAPSITENLYLVGAGDKLVGCTSYCTMAVNNGVQQIGSTIDVNIEKILSLKPDLVLTMLMTKPQDVEALRKLGVRVEILSTPKSFNEICEQTLQIARLTGNEKTAEQVVSSARQQVENLKNQMKNKPRQKVFFQLGANPVFTVLPNTFMNDFILFSNCDNIANGMKTGIITRESVLSRNPDVIFIATMGGFGEQEKKVWENYKGLKAAETKKVFLIDSETSCSPTPDNFAKAFADVVKSLNR
ncbi:MAG: ABC transporter substrate-binding protein [Draconibacterium sp.]